MRACKALFMVVLVLVMGAVQASSRSSATLRISLTVVDRCDIRGGTPTPSIECSDGVPWAVVPPPDAVPLAVADPGQAGLLPVPAGGAIDGTPVTAIVF